MGEFWKRSTAGIEALTSQITGNVEPGQGSMIPLPQYLEFFPTIVDVVMKQKNPLNEPVFETLFLFPVTHHLSSMDLGTVQKLGSALNAQIVVGRGRQDLHKPELIAQIAGIHDMLKDREEQLLGIK